MSWRMHVSNVLPRFTAVFWSYLRKTKGEKRTSNGFRKETEDLPIRCRTKGWMSFCVLSVFIPVSRSSLESPRGYSRDFSRIFLLSRSSTTFPERDLDIPRETGWETKGLGMISAKKQKETKGSRRKFTARRKNTKKIQKGDKRKQKQTDVNPPQTTSQLTQSTSLTENRCLKSKIRPLCFKSFVISFSWCSDLIGIHDGRFSCCLFTRFNFFLRQVIRTDACHFDYWSFQCVVFLETTGSQRQSEGRQRVCGPDPAWRDERHFVNCRGISVRSLDLSQTWEDKGRQRETKGDLGRQTGRKTKKQKKETRKDKRESQDDTERQKRDKERRRNTEGRRRDTKKQRKQKKNTDTISAIQDSPDL